MATTTKTTTSKRTTSKQSTQSPTKRTRKTAKTTTDTVNDVPTPTVPSELCYSSPVTKSIVYKISKTRSKSTVHLSMTLHEVDGTPIECDYSVSDLVTLLKLNRNIAEIGIGDRIYMYLFNTGELIEFLHDNRLIDDKIYKSVAASKF